MTRAPIAFGVFVVLTAALSGGCGHTAPFQKTQKISEILASPSQYQGKDVKVEGKVTESLIAFQFGYFTLSDGTGSIPIIPSSTYPKVGEKVTIKGAVRNSFVIGSAQLTVIEER